MQGSGEEKCLFIHSGTPTSFFYLLFVLDVQLCVLSVGVCVVLLHIIEENKKKNTESHNIFYAHFYFLIFQYIYFILFFN